MSIVPGHDECKNENANQNKVDIVTCLFITIENRSATVGRIHHPIWDFKVDRVAKAGLDANENFQDFGDRDGNGTREGVLISNPLP